MAQSERLIAPRAVAAGILLAAVVCGSASSAPLRKDQALADGQVRTDLSDLRAAVDELEALSSASLRDEDLPVTEDGRERLRARVRAGLAALEGRHRSKLGKDLRGLIAPANGALQSLSSQSGAHLARAMGLVQLDAEIKALVRDAESALRNEAESFAAAQRRRRERRSVKAAAMGGAGLLLAALALALAVVSAREGEAPEAAKPPPWRTAALRIEPPPAKIGRYRVVRVLGEGSLGTVFEAVPEEGGKAVAVKRLRPELHRSAPDVERLVARVRAAARLEHPNIVRTFDPVMRGNRVHVVMELLDGVMLDELLALGPLPPSRVKKLFRQLCPAVDHIHRSEMVHGDIRPSNILLSEGRVAKLLDTGLGPDLRRCAREQGWDLPPEATEFRDPEESLEGYAAKSDLHSLAALLRAMMPGAPTRRFTDALDLMDAVEEMPG